MKRYAHLEDGERRLLPAQFKGEVYHKLACCDCGLVHKMRVKVLPKGEGIELTAWRDRRSTAAIRRARATLVHNVAARMSASSGKNHKSK